MRGALTGAPWESLWVSSDAGPLLLDLGVADGDDLGVEHHDNDNNENNNVLTTSQPNDSNSNKSNKSNNNTYNNGNNNT